MDDGSLAFVYTIRKGKKGRGAVEAPGCEKAGAGLECYACVVIIMVVLWGFSVMEKWREGELFKREK